MEIKCICHRIDNKCVACDQYCLKCNYNVNNKYFCHAEVSPNVRIDFLINKINELEEKIDTEIIMRKDLRDFCFDVLKNGINDLNIDLHRIQSKEARKKPHNCLVCDGRGGFYINGTMDSECNTCQGKGIIWE